ncbi:hypothetical protein RUM43_008345 [Polyplax serrata]|uniref:SNRNP25 ubiquitin-like domain-containing protein n=1 Tax=Polyplax serrata TaxID=468196 RepID=A0AAN8S2E2_POLSC
MDRDTKKGLGSVNFTHEELMEISITSLNELLAQDTFLCDLPNAVTLEEVNSQIALQYGRSIKIYVLRSGDERMPVIVPQDVGTVADLKKSIKRSVNLKLNRSKKNKFKRKLISWKYFWRIYDLKHNNNLLNNSNAKLADLGIKNKSCVHFVKKYKKMKHNM